MNITVYKRYDTPASAGIRFFDEDTGKEIGYAIYGVEKHWVSHKGKEVQEPQGRIYDMVLDKPYRRKGILTQILPGILCDLKCKGVKKTVALFDASDGAWSKFGFKKKPNSKDLYLDINRIKCECMSKAVRLVEDEYDETKPIKGEKDCCRPYYRS